MSLLNGLKKNLYLLVFLLLAAVIMWDLLKPGYILTIDMSLGPYSPRMDLLNHLNGIGINLSNSAAIPLVKTTYFGVTYLLGLVFPAWLIQKLWLFLLLAFSGIAMYRAAPTENRYGRYFAGFLYMVNPFIYVRFLSGHFWLLWGYAFLPLAVKSFIDLFDRPSVKRVLVAGVWLMLIAPSEHLLVMAWGIFFLFFVFNLIRGDQRRLKKIAVFSGVIALFLVLNGNWVASIISGGGVAQTLQGMATRDIELFAASGDGNVFLNAAAMYGFWRGGYDYPKYHLWGWQLIFFIILFFAVYGFVSNFRGKRGLYVKVMGTTAVVSFIATIGASQEQLSKFVYFLYEKVPLLIGFRDSQKFVALIVLAYAYLGSIGMSLVEQGVQRLKKWLSPIFGVFILLLLLLYSYTMFFGFHGQLKNIDYPQDYYEVNSLLRQDEADFQVLFLPWHQSMGFAWVGKVIANPAESFFIKPVIRGDNIEMGDIYSQSTNPVSKYIEAIIRKGKEIQDFGEFVSPLKVKYIVLAKEVDWEEYLFLREQRDLAIIKDTPHLLVFINRSYSEYAPPIRGKAELLDLEDETIDHLEENIMVYGKRPQFWPGYLLSGLFFLGCLGYILRRRK